MYAEIVKTLAFFKMVLADHVWKFLENSKNLSIFYTFFCKKKRFWLHKPTYGWSHTSIVKQVTNLILINFSMRPKFSNIGLRGAMKLGSSSICVFFYASSHIKKWNIFFFWNVRLEKKEKKKNQSPFMHIFLQTSIRYLWVGTFFHNFDQIWQK